MSHRKAEIITGDLSLQFTLPFPKKSLASGLWGARVVGDRLLCYRFWVLVGFWICDMPPEVGFADLDLKI